jgi:heme iron utilization protein
MSQLSDEEIIKRFETFDKDKQSLIISTADAEGTPLTNYSPFVKLDGDYYICVSSMLPHYKNMIETKKAHVLIIEDEATAGHIYARNRLYFSVECMLEPDAEKIFKLFDARYGDQLAFLRDMKDFKVIKLVPQDKSLVLGFGAAYKMDKEGNFGYKTIQHKR